MTNSKQRASGTVKLNYKAGIAQSVVVRNNAFGENSPNHANDNTVCFSHGVTYPSADLGMSRENSCNSDTEQGSTLEVRY